MILIIKKQIKLKKMMIDHKFQKVIYLIIAILLNDWFWYTLLINYYYKFYIILKFFYLFEFVLFKSGKHKIF